MFYFKIENIREVTIKHNKKSDKTYNYEQDYE